MDNTKFRLPQKEKRSFTQILRIYLLPLAVGLGFILIIVLLIIPTIFGMFATLDEISSKNRVYQENLALLSQLQSLNSGSTTLIQQLNSVNNITTADQTEVVKFRNKITEVVTDNSLSIFSQQLTETDPTIISNGISQDITLKEVPFTFKIEGSYNDIVRFFNDLGVIDDFVIIKEMSFSRTEKLAPDNSTIWVLDLVLVKYQFNTSASLDEVYESVLPNVQISEKVLEYINRRN